MRLRKQGDNGGMGKKEEIERLSAVVNGGRAQERRGKRKNMKAGGWQ